MVELSAHLANRREAVLRAWQAAVAADPKQSTSRSLTRGQFRDHIPQVLDAFQRKLNSIPGGRRADAADVEQKQEEVKHGLHRWQQGYRLQELMMEWGHLQVCLFEEINAYAQSRTTFGPRDFAEANRHLIALVNEAIGNSAGQYERMEQAEANGHLHALQGALERVNEVEARRSELIHQAVHDLGSNVFGVEIAARLLGRPDLDLAERNEFALLLNEGVKSVTHMLQDLMELARLEAGQEIRKIGAFDPGATIRTIGQINQPYARERGLFLSIEEAAPVSVLGDRERVGRILQNLLMNALRYTECGGVTVSWGAEIDHWWLMVRDTGPGLPPGPEQGLGDGLQEATASARESDVKVAASHGESSQVLDPEEPAATTPANVGQPSGEGIGLSIVKRLCELLDASLELASSAETGTTFRVVFPLAYGPAEDATEEISRN